MEHKFNYLWNLSDLANVKPNGCKVFSTFSCGGGSSMGYKLAGYELVGNLEIDKNKNDAYVKNHHPKYNFNEDVRKFRLRDDLPQELYCLDVLDGSPPCLTFSMSGCREEKWNVVTEHYGITQRWDDLFFEYIALAEKLQPKVVVAENVKGILLGEAIDYVRNIYDGFDKAGYYCQHFLLNSSVMGVPQKRERVFFVCLRKDLAIPFLRPISLFEEKPYIDMEFKEQPILFGEYSDHKGHELPKDGKMYEYWTKRIPSDRDFGDITKREYGECRCFNNKLIKEDEVVYTITTENARFVLYDEPKLLSKHETMASSTFPMDYDFGANDFCELCGRSVPPIMMAQISSRIYEQWLSKI